MEEGRAVSPLPPLGGCFVVGAIALEDIAWKD